MNVRPVLRVKELSVEWGIGTHLRILFGGANLSVDFQDNFRRHPPPAQALVLIELSLVRLHSVLPRGTQHTDKVKILLIDPELRGMQVACFCSYHIDGPALPSVFAQNRKIKLESFQRVDDIRHRQFVNIKAKNHQRMNEWPVA